MRLTRGYTISRGSPKWAADESACKPGGPAGRLRPVLAQVRAIITTPMATDVTPLSHRESSDEQTTARHARARGVMGDHLPRRRPDGPQAPAQQAARGAGARAGADPSPRGPVRVP